MSSGAINKRNHGHNSSIVTNLAILAPVVLGVGALVAQFHERMTQVVGNVVLRFEQRLFPDHFDNRTIVLPPPNVSSFNLPQGYLPSGMRSARVTVNVGPDGVATVACETRFETAPSKPLWIPLCRFDTNNNGSPMELCPDELGTGLSSQVLDGIREIDPGFFTRDPVLTGLINRLPRK